MANWIVENNGSYHLVRASGNLKPKGAVEKAPDSFDPADTHWLKRRQNGKFYIDQAAKQAALDAIAQAKQEAQTERQNLINKIKNVRNISDPTTKEVLMGLIGFLIKELDLN